MNGWLLPLRMYLRPSYDLIVRATPLCARIAERLTRVPTVSTGSPDGARWAIGVGDRHLSSPERPRWPSPMRTAAERSVDVIGLLRVVHAEACRWEHVMSEDVERRSRCSTT